MILSEYTDKIIEIEKESKYRPKAKMRSKNKADYTALVSIAQVEEDDEEDDQGGDHHYSDDDDDEEDSAEVQFVRSSNRGRGRGRGRGRARGRGWNGDRRRQPHPSR